ncbi:MAG: phosphorylase [Anaerolinea sp.]|nr:phosphorylase [Anaerolinea sp.]
MKPKSYPILDFDPSPTAIIEPSKIIKKRDYSHKVLFCFFKDVFTKLVNTGQAQQVDRLISEMGENPIYQVELRGESFMAVQPGVGAPQAVGFMEEMIARGSDQFIACGGCGVLNPEIAVGHILVPNSAIRDEGTSYAYLPPAVEIQANQRVIRSIQDTLDLLSVDFIMVKTWTTDAIYRETIKRARLRREQGCSVVEMETAAFMAVAQFRNVEFGQLLYGGDSVHEDGWDQRSWDKRGDIRQSLFWLAAEVLLAL